MPAVVPPEEVARLVSQAMDGRIPALRRLAASQLRTGVREGAIGPELAATIPAELLCPAPESKPASGSHANVPPTPAPGPTTAAEFYASDQSA